MSGYPLQALFLFNSLFVLGSSLVLGWLFRKRQDLSANYWIAAGLMSSLVTTLTAFKPELSNSLGYILPNTLQVLTVCLVGCAFLSLCGVVLRPRWVATAGVAVAAFGAGLVWLQSLSASTYLVSYVSLTNGLLTLGVAWMVGRYKRHSLALRYLEFPRRVLVVMGVVWLLRVPLSLSGLAQQVMDASLGNWLIFVSLLAMNIVLQFAYLGVRLTDTLEKQLQLTTLNQRLQALVDQHEALMRRLNSNLAALPHLPAQTLSAQMAHELNQPLAALRLKLDAVMSFPAAGEAPMKAMLTDIERMGSTLRGLQHLLPSHSPQLAVVGLRGLLAEVVRVLPQVESACASRDELPVQVDGPLLAKTLTTLIQWLQAYGRAPSDPGRHLLRLSCSPAADAAWALIRLEVPGVQLDEDAQMLLNSGKVLAPIGLAGPLQDAQQLIDILVVQHALRTQRGRVTVEPQRSGEGVTLVLRLPLDRPQQARVSP